MSGAHSSTLPSRSSSFGTPDLKAGIMWRPRSHSFGPDSVLDLPSGQSELFGRRETPQGHDAESHQHKRLGRKSVGDGVVRTTQNHSIHDACGCKPVAC